jgi:hypothetical protein
LPRRELANNNRIDHPHAHDAEPGERDRPGNAQERYDKTAARVCRVRHGRWRYLNRRRRASGRSNQRAAPSRNSHKRK